MIHLQTLVQLVTQYVQHVQLDFQQVVLLEIKTIGGQQLYLTDGE